MKLPQTLIDANYFVDGLGHLGVSKSLQLPKLEKIRNTIKAGGFEKDVDTGIFKKLEAESVFAEWSPTIMAAMAAGQVSGAGVNLTIKASINQGNKKIAVFISMQGGVDLDPGKLEAGKEVEYKVKHFPTYFMMEIDGKQGCLFDTENMIAIIDGVDYLEELRNQIL